jgi:hypothetical protein
MNFLFIKKHSKKIIFLFLSIPHCISVQAQKDTIPRHHLSANIAAGMLSGELGFYYDLRVSKYIGLQLSYGHRFYSFNLVENGIYDFDYKYAPQQGDIARIGVKVFFTRKPDIALPPAYFLYRFSYWKFHTPTYTVTHANSGWGNTEMEVLSVDKDVFNFGIGVGKEFHFENHLYMDMFASIGISQGKKITYKYYHGHSDPYEIKYPDNTYTTEPALFPTLELGFKLGGFW